MAEVTMSLYEALSRKKILESQVNKIQTYRLVDVRKKNSEVSASGEELETVKKNAQSGYDSTVAVLNNFIALKTAINEANAKTMVKVAGKEYTIANAIMRQRLIDTEERIYNAMISNIEACKNEIDKSNRIKLDEEAVANHVRTVLGDSKKDEDLIEKTKKSYIDRVEVSLYDPLNTQELATKKLDEIALFREQIHTALTQVNCSTMITVEFAD